MRLTRIVATLGPASLEIDVLCQLITAGVDVFRCNFSHGTIETHQAACEAVREAARRVGRDVALLQDLCGPKIRSGEMTGGEVDLIDGQDVTITTSPVVGTSMLFSTTYKQMPRDVAPGTKILLDDGLLELEVISIADMDIHCRVVHGGKLRSHKGINLPGVALSTPSITPVDFDNLAAGAAIGFDYVALSFVRSADDILKVKRTIEKFANPPLIIAKIEKEEALDDIDAIIDAADGIMIARGDLAVELSPERVPIIQQNLIHRANTADKLVIVATQMLESMRENFTATRAEVNDVAIAVYEGADAVMLSAETATGRYPVEAVKTMARVAETMEHKLAIDGHPHWNWKRSRIYHPLGDALSNAAYDIAKSLSAAAIVAYTHSGRTGMYLSKCRPFMQLIVFTRRPEVARKMKLFWGVVPVCVPEITTAGDLRQYAGEYLRDNNLCGGADNIVIISGNPFDVIDHSNIIEVTQFLGGAATLDRANQKKGKRFNPLRAKK